MKKIFSIVVIAVALLTAHFVKAQLVNTEGFENVTFPPSGWSISGNQWTRSNVGNNPSCMPHSGTGMARFTAFMQPQGSQEVLISPVVNYIGASGTAPAMSLWIYRDNSSTAGDSLSIFVNNVATLTGATHIGAVARSRFFNLPNNELANGWFQYTFNVPVTFTTDTNYILLNGTARGGGNIFIDDLSWEEYPVACTSAFTAGTVSATDTLICGGSGDADLSLTGSGLTTGGLTFQWQSATDNTGPWTNIGGNTNSINTGTITASAYFRCYVTCVNGAVTDTSSFVYIAVSPDPAPVVSINLGQNVNYCTGSAPLELIATGADTYSWFPNIGVSASGDSALASPTATTIFTVTGTDAAGCSDAASITVTAIISPVIEASSNLDTICEGQFANLHAVLITPMPGIQYQWQPGSINGANTTVQPTTTTLYTVTGTSGVTGCAGRDSIEIFVYPSPVAAFSFAINNLTYTFTDGSTGATSWDWDFGDGNTDNTQNPVHTYATPGTYTVTLTVSNGNCSNTSAQVLIVLSLNEATFSNGSAIQINPNPVTDAAYVEFTLNEPSAQLIVINTFGQAILNKILTTTSNDLFRTKIDLTELSSGVYFLNVKSKTESVYLRFIKL